MEQPPENLHWILDVNPHCQLNYHLSVMSTDAAIAGGILAVSSLVLWRKKRLRAHISVTVTYIPSLSELLNIRPEEAKADLTFIASVLDDAPPGTQEYIMLRQDSIQSAELKKKESPFRAKCHEIFCCPLKQVHHKENTEPEATPTTFMSS
ncbi:fibroblast growth factor 13 isoform 2 [Cricetulus griseus]|uniref:Fibroblast growth factor 13 isoform 2 n=1 Tax=Cricetulus griseus TaxID=10029 RepID=A0A061I061_CRIGR|nr:fibroblast growth factor 13 isoform 2 [Cricetulus griseus]